MFLISMIYPNINTVALHRKKHIEITSFLLQISQNCCYPAWSVPNGDEGAFSCYCVEKLKSKYLRYSYCTP